MEKVRVRQQVEKVRTVLFSEKTLHEFCVGRPVGTPHGPYVNRQLLISINVILSTDELSPSRERRCQN